MKQIPLREFQLHPKKYLKELPLALVNRDGPVADLIPHVNKTENVNISEKVATLQKQIVNIAPIKTPMNQMKDFGTCQAPGILRPSR